MILTDKSYRNKDEIYKIYCMIPDIMHSIPYGVQNTSRKTVNLIAQNSWIITSYHKNQISVFIIFMSQDLGKIWQCILFKGSPTTDLWGWQRCSKCANWSFMLTPTLSSQVDAPKVRIVTPQGKAAFSWKYFTVWNFLINTSWESVNSWGGRHLCPDKRCSWICCQRRAVPRAALPAIPVRRRRWLWKRCLW